MRGMADPAVGWVRGVVYAADDLEGLAAFWCAVLGTDVQYREPGWVELRLDSRSWWVYARSPDPLDPNAEWYWNLPAAADTLRFDPTTGRHLPRY